MKIRSLLTLALCLSASFMFAQLQVVAPNGFVGINTSTPTQRLEIADEANNTPGFLINAGSGTNFVKAAAGASGSGFFYRGSTFFALIPATDATQSGVSTNNFWVGPDAKVGIGGVQLNPEEQLVVLGNVKGTSFINSSDRRLKKDIKSYDKGLKEILHLNPVSYAYNGKGGTIDGDKQIGIIAQELQEVAPELVKEFVHSEYGDVSLAEAIPQPRSKETYLSVKDSQIKFMLINAIKEQQAIITRLEARISSLEKNTPKIEKSNTADKNN